MAIRVKHNVLVQISQDTSAKEKFYYPDTKETIIDVFDRQSVKNVQVAAAASEAMNLSDIDDVRGMFLELDGDCSVEVNGNAIPMQRASTATGTKARLFLEGAITSLTIDNTSGASAINGILVLWGDPTA